MYLLFCCVAYDTLCKGWVRFYGVRKPGFIRAHFKLVKLVIRSFQKIKRFMIIIFHLSYIKIKAKSSKKYFLSYSYMFWVSRLYSNDFKLLSLYYIWDLLGTKVPHNQTDQITGPNKSTCLPDCIWHHMCLIIC